MCEEYEPIISFTSAPAHTICSCNPVYACCVCVRSLTFSCVFVRTFYNILFLFRCIRGSTTPTATHTHLNFSWPRRALHATHSPSAIRHPLRTTKFISSHTYSTPRHYWIIYSLCTYWSYAWYFSLSTPFCLIFVFVARAEHFVPVTRIPVVGACLRTQIQNPKHAGHRSTHDTHLHVAKW